MRIVIRGCILAMLLIALTAPLKNARAQSPTPVPVPFPGYGAFQHRGEIGMRFSFTCLGQDKAPGGYIIGSNLYGTDVYMIESGVCAAAAQVGLITLATGGTVAIEIRPAAGQYKGSTRNGVTSADYNPPPDRDGSFVVVGRAPPGDTPPATGTPPAQSSCDWTGIWNRNGEVFSFVQIVGLPTGAAPIIQMTGTGVSDPTWRLSGTVAGNVLTGKWSDHTGSGSIRIVFAQDCNSFESSWGPGADSSTFTGHGVRVSPSGMSLEAPRRLALPNDLVLIPVTLNNAAHVANLNFDLQYNAAVIRPEGNLLKGNLLDNALFSGNPAQPGLIRNGFAQTGGLVGTGTVVNIPFRIVGKPGDKSPLALNVTTINDPSGGVLTIQNLPGEVLITNSDGALPGGGGGGILHGDCDGDSHLTESDALCALEMSVQLRPVQLIMDMDNSGDVTSRDAVIILQTALGK